MKYIYFTILFSLFSLTASLASTTDSISTVYKNGQFTTYSQVLVNASDTICAQVTRDYDYQTRYNLDALFSWALKGLNMRKEKNEIMMFYFKSTSFNKETNILRGVGDVIVPGIVTFPNIYVDCKLTSKPTEKGRTGVNLDLKNSNGFIRNMNNSFTMITLPNNKGNWFILETNVKFGWFFNIFLTQKRFKAIMEWRLKRFIHNLKDEAERRERNLAANKLTKDSANK